MMTLLFAFGVMSLPWVAVLAVAITVEKVAPAGDKASKWLGTILLLAGTGSMIGIVGP